MNSTATTVTENIDTIMTKYLPLNMTEVSTVRCHRIMNVTDKRQQQV